MARGRGNATPQDKDAMIFISNKINQLLLENNLKQSHLADTLKIPRSSFNEYVKGNALPKPGNVQKIADHFGLLKSDIDPRFKSEKSTSTLQKINDTSKQLNPDRQIVVLDTAKNQLAEQNTVENSEDIEYESITYHTYDYYDQALSAGTGQYLNDVRVETIELPVDYDADFVVPIYGDSMEPKYNSGDYVFVKLSVDLSDSNIGVFEYYGDAYIKQLLINENGAFLHSLNSKYEDIPIDANSDFRIIGRVTGKYPV